MTTRVQGGAMLSKSEYRRVRPVRDANPSGKIAPEAQAPCRFCGAALGQLFVDLGMSPLCESFLRADQLDQMEPFYPLRAYVCDRCFLVQLREYVSPENIFSEYAYFSSYSDTWLAHARQYADLMERRFGLDSKSLVIELASNDGYLLQYFVAKGIPVLGIDPAANVAAVAERNGVRTLVRFFDRKLARELAAQGIRADLVAGNNVLAQVPNLNDFVAGVKMILRPRGVATLEFPHLMRLIDENQFDTIYHEHFSYFSFTTAEKIFRAAGLTVFDVEELPTHGGSLRIYARHTGNRFAPIEERVERLRACEEEQGFGRIERYLSFDSQVRETKRNLLAFLIEARRAGRHVVGYGAPGKGNTLLNYCGVRSDFIDYMVDRSPHKQGKVLPGTHIPILHPDRIIETRPDYLLVMPWNLKQEIIKQTAYIREWGGRHVVAIPRLEVVS